MKICKHSDPGRKAKKDCGFVVTFSKLINMQRQRQAFQDGAQISSWTRNDVNEAESEKKAPL